MKSSLLIIASLFCSGIYAQEHYAGINTSKRVGILNTVINPAEFANLSNDHEIHAFSVSANVANNKLTFGEILSGNNFESLIFAGDEPTNLRADIDILGPSFAMKVDKWAFGITSSAKIRANMVDVNVDLANAVTNSGIEALFGTYDISTGYNQRATATSWGEIGFSAARELFDDEEHRFTGGATFKLLFPGSYANMAASNFEGRVENVAGNVDLVNASAMVNIAYSGSLAGDYNDNSNFTRFFAGGLNGFATDLGVNYQWKDMEDGGYRLNAGISVRNIGSMTFKDDNNISRTYDLNVDGIERFDLNQFENANSIEEIQQIIENSGYVNINETQRNFRVNLPTVFSVYADVKLHNNWHATGFIQQKVNEDNDNQQIAVQNLITVTPRYTTGFFEAFAPLSHNEISGFTAGIGARVGGFFIGSGSVLSAVFGNTEQADAFIGFRYGF